MAADRAFRACACFFSANIFVGRCGMHVCYRDERQFRRDYGRALRERGCGGEEQMAAVLREIEAEVQRRKHLVRQSAERKAIIAQCYKRKHSEVYTLQDSFLAPGFLEIIRYCTSSDANLHGLLRYTESFSASGPSEHFLGTYSRHVNQYQVSQLDGEAWKQRVNMKNNKSIPELILRNTANSLSSQSMK
ncbi:2-oxoglutarate and iron-dependent oxygenase domain-containing protein 2-like [Lagopus muta]|uniref:2-oxoglutarate and iron-dependent oxygenase domain-containing protein 2-like n=1 Tax=Lagopus muta TaxID=64668 RepID=UPI00209E4B3B|nr:2-oxoglutarate and iron-dependent oxygenase domain-containing protein 2-like [Lagopus muta]